MAVVGEALVWLATALLLVPLAVLTVEFLLALVPSSAHVSGTSNDRSPCDILIPAHDEEAGIGQTLADLRTRLRPGDRVLVVADNCTDRTADLARAAGVEVLERFDEARRGKGYALDAGLRKLAESAATQPRVVVILDADCRLVGGSLDALVEQVGRTGRPAQARYRMHPPEGATAKQRASAFALIIKNEVRPSGLSRLGLPCLLGGSGMAFPPAAIFAAELADGNIVEDMQLGLNLALAGHAPRFCQAAQVVSEAPGTERATHRQRSRWEQGHLRTLIRNVPRLAAAGARRLDVGLLALALETGVPPVSLLAAASGMLLALTAGLWAVAAISPGPALSLAAGMLVTLAAGLACWARFGRDVLPPAALASLPAYALWKLPIYLRFVVSPEREWVRTDRGPSADTGLSRPECPPVDSGRSGSAPPLCRLGTEPNP